MIYCPHCKRPSARESGACPHCGLDLVPGAPRAVEADVDGAREAESHAGATFEFEDEGGPLELDHGSVPPPPRTAPSPAAPAPATPGPAPRPVAPAAGGDRDEVMRIAGFGSPRPGPLGAVSYGLKVRSQLATLRVERAAAAREADQAAAQLASLLADLGRRADGLGLAAGPSLERLAEAARLEQSGREGVAKRREGLAEDHRAAKAALIGKRGAIERDAEPVREEEREAAAALARLENDQRRAEARANRLRIELRNIGEIMARRQQEYADPKRSADEKRLLLAGIAEQDHKQPGLRAQLAEQEEAARALAAPVAEAAARLAGVGERLNAALAGIAAIDRELRESDRRFEEDRARLATELEGGETRARDAWARIGETLLDEDTGEGLDDLRAAATDARTRERAAARRLDLLDRALVAYDSGVVAQAKLVGLLAVAGAVALAGLVFWLAL